MCLVNHGRMNSCFLPFKVKTYLRLSFFFYTDLSEQKLSEHETMWLGQWINKTKQNTVTFSCGHVMAKSNQAAICLDFCLKIQKEDLSNWKV